MRALSYRLFPAAVQRPGIFSLLLLLVLVLAACSTGSKPGSAPDLAAQPAGKTVPPVVIQQITGLPPGKAADLKAALARAAGERDIGIVEGNLQDGGFSLSGRFKALSDSAGVRVIYQWQLRDTDGVLVHTYDGEENAGLSSGSDPWVVVTAAVFDRIAKASAESFAVRLSQMGYATRLSALQRPPAQYFAMAGPGAEREVDMETLDGPLLAMAGELQGEETEQAGDAALAASEPAAPPARPADPQAAEGSAPGKAANKMEISAVAVLPVSGSPGGGNAELTSALRRVLAAAGWPVVSKPQPNAIIIAGEVDVSKPSGNQQKVSVNWVVKTPAGSKLGHVKQANSVPAGTLDLGWGEAARVVAEGAAAGIFDIVKRYQ